MLNDFLSGSAAWGVLLTLAAFAECSITDRQELQARLDALVARLYGLSFPTLRQIISVYPSLYNSDTIERIEKCFHHFK